MDGRSRAALTHIPAALGLAVLCLGGSPEDVLAKPVMAEPAAESFTIGPMRVTALRDADNVLANDGSVIGVGVPTSAVAQVLKAAGAPTDNITLGVDALLVQTSGRVMLFDTGLGPSVHGALMGSIAKAGLSPSAVTDVMITHSHGDHVGGLATADGQLAFPAATIHMSAPEWAFMQSQSQSKALVATITSKVKTFEPEAEVVPGVISVSLAGHTPGHVGYQIGAGDHRLLDMGDVAHSSIVSLAKPEWAIAYDHDESEGEATRRKELDQLATSHELVFAPHFPFPGIGRIKAEGSGFVWQPKGGGTKQVR